MTERLLQYIWQFQYFNTSELETTKGEKIKVLYPGQWNHHQGPDFSHARIQIEQKIWAGNIELHLNSADWKRHGHHLNKQYDTIILHVVWKNDDLLLSERMPTLVLDHRISGLLLHQYQTWMKETSFIPCATQVYAVNNFTWISWKERLLIERMERKYYIIQSMLQNNRYHWEETLWWMLARSFGLYVNAASFEAIARSIPFTILVRHRVQLFQLEALLMGQAGLLNADRPDPYYQHLKNEYLFLRLKYALHPVPYTVLFLRMRPPAFPTIRLAQLAMMLHKNGSMLSYLLQAQEVKEIHLLLDIAAGDYWNDHFIFGEPGIYAPKHLGLQMANTIVINGVVPLVFAYGQFHQSEQYKSRALRWLETLSSEKNSTVQGFSKLGISSSNAAESQALVELKTQYCDHRHCLDCAVGNFILKRT